MLSEKEQEVVFLSLVAGFEVNEISLSEESYQHLAIVSDHGLDNIYFQILNVLKMNGYQYKETTCKMTWRVFQSFIEGFQRFAEQAEHEGVKISCFTDNFMEFSLAEARQTVIDFYNDPDEFEAYYGKVELSIKKGKVSQRLPKQREGQNVIMGVDLFLIEEHFPAFGYHKEKKTE